MYVLPQSVALPSSSRVHARPQPTPQRTRGSDGGDGGGDDGGDALSCAPAHRCAIVTRESELKEKIPQC